MNSKKRLIFTNSLAGHYFSFNQLFSFLFFWLLTFFALYTYIDYSDNWVATGIGPIFKDHIYYFEFPLIYLLSSFIFFPQVKNIFVRFLLPIVPVVILYGLFDGFYNFLGRAPYPSDFDNFQAVFNFSPVMAIILGLIFLTIPMIILFLIYKAYVACNPNRLSHFKYSLVVRLALFFGFFLFINTEVFSQFHQKNFDYVVWSQEDTVRDNGKFSSFIYYNNQEKINRKHLEEINKDAFIDVHKTLYPGEISQPRNIHVIVLESFIDPRKLENIQFDRTPLAEELIPYLNNKQTFSLVTSPIYGGGTAQAEFELLTGTPALSKVNRIEYNVMNGGNTQSFVEKLNQNNYKTIATVATNSGYFNSKQAYQSLGFSQVNYLEDDPQFAEELKLGPIFDGNVFDYNLKQVKTLLNQNEGPVFNYVLGMFGHMPFRRNELERPDKIVVEHADERVKRISNQFYYRTKAIAEYLDQLIAMDENAVIYVTSDHLPSILGEKVIYQLDKKTNIALFFDKNMTIDVTGKKLYQLPWFIWDRLTEKDNQRELDETTLENLYYQILSESISESSIKH